MHRIGKKPLLAKITHLVLPFGKLRLACVFLLVFLQAVFQVLSVASIFPFLALAADPGQFYNSRFGKWVLSIFPDLSGSQMLILAGMATVALLVVSSVVNILSEVTRNRYAHSFGHWLRLRLLRKILSQPYSYFLANNSAVLFKKVYSDVMAFVSSVLLPLLDVMARSIIILLLISSLFVVQFEITAVAIATLAIFYVSIYLVLKRKRAQISRDFRNSWKRCGVELQQLFTGIKPIKVSETESIFVERFETPSKIIADHGAWMPVYMQVPRYVIDPVLFGGVICLVIYFDYKDLGMMEILPSMGLLAFTGYRLLPSVQLLYGQLTKIGASRFALDEVYTEFERSRHMMSMSTDRTQAYVQPLEWFESISIESVYFQYLESDGLVFSDLNFEIEKNNSVAFVGKSGSGKSTIVDLILGLHQPQSGRISVDGNTISDENSSRFLAAIGYVPQDVFLTDDTIEANIAFGIPHSDVSRERLDRVAKVAQIHHFIEDELQHGYSTVVGERGARLSGGQRQRIGLARALYRNPSILILDEATSALDNETEAKLMESINSLSGELTIIVIAHRLTTVRDCDQIFVVEDGKIRSEKYEALNLG